MAMLSLLTWTLLLGTGAPQPTPLPVSDAVMPAQEKGVTEKAEEPPPSTYDLERRQGQKEGPVKSQEEERSWTGQLVRTILALLFVIALIYLVFKVGVQRLMGISSIKRSGKALRVIERCQLDARHAILLVEVDGRRLMLGTGEHGVQLLMDLSTHSTGSLKDKRGDFGAALARAEMTGSPGPETTSRDT